MVPTNIALGAKLEVYMRHVVLALCATLSVMLVPDAQASPQFVEGKDYSVLIPAQPTTVPAGKVEVMEVFSYGCIVCNNFQPVMDRLKHSLPSNAQMTYLPASFNASEDWPMFQRAYLAAQSMGIADRTHQAVFDAVWKTGELAISRAPMPTIQDAARCYARIAGVRVDNFLAAANSFDVYRKMQSADSQIEKMKVPGTPCFVVNGKYRIEMGSLHNTDELIDMVKFLVNKESGH
jgi:thiol:disulfide interchange protein DsbA